MRLYFVSATLALSQLALAQPASGPNPNPQTHGYYRQPAIHGDTIVFVSEGDLWRVPASGGMATRLTTGTGEEAHPAISPDGKTIAFLGTYEGPGEIYTMPIDGGLPVRQTFGASRVSFVDWTPSGKVLYSTREFATLPSSQLVAFTPRAREADPIEASAVEHVPLYEADQGVYSDDGKTLFFTRLPFQGSNTKRYQGGFIQQLWKFGAGDVEATPLTTDYAGTSKDAMWWQGRVYFASDRDGIMNIWSMDQSGKDLKQHTKHAEYDVASPGQSNGRIAYQHGADIWLLDLSSGKDSQIPIQISSDFDQMREDWIKEPAKAIASTSVSPNGDRVALTARGQVFVAPAKQGRFVDVTQKSGTRFRNATFLPDGKSLLAFSDASGEVELWKLPANGVGEPTQITNDSEILRFAIVPSPDGKLVAHTDKNQKLYITDLDAKSTKTIIQNKTGDIGEVSWSADSKWLVFAAPAPNANSVINLYSVATGQITPVTTDRFDCASPVFSPDGKWLYLLSDRNFQSTVQSPWGPLAPQPHFDKRTRVYTVSLKKGQRSPWRPNDELNAEKKDDARKEDKKDEKKDEGKAEGDKPKDDKKDDKKTEKPPPEVIIDLDGIQSRLEEVPIPASNYGNLNITEKSVFFTDFTRGDTKTNLIGVNIGNEKIETKTVASDIRRFELSHDRKKILIQKQSPGGNASLLIVDAAAAPADLDGKSVDLSKWKFSLVPAIEWKQMYVDAWRLLRDYFYATNMHGVDWPAMKAKYAPLVERVRTRAELNDILAQLSGELSTLHHFVRGGDIRDSSDDIANAFLGAEMVRDPAGWKVQHIFDFDPDEPGSVPPLARPGVDVTNGDVIEQINGIALSGVADPASLLRGKAGQQVLLRVKPASGAASRDVIVTPMSGNEAADLRYSAWEYTRRLEVEKKGNAEIGYVHLRNMGGGEIGRWAKNFFPVYNRAGLIIDVRRNTGGNIDSWILGALIRKAWMFWNARVGQPDSWNMQFAFRGHMVVLADAFTASDGEAFSEGFKRLGLGKVIGTRTWGGEVWLSMDNRLSDGGVASAGETGVFGPDGIWLVEGKGVVPDIEVDNLPHATFEGKDAQLDAAIAHLQQLIKEKPVLPPQPPALPNKSFTPAR